MEISVTRMSSKGQVVIPSEMRKHLSPGEKLLIIQEGNNLVLKQASSLDKSLKEDLEFASRTDEALKRFEKGQFTEMESKTFLKALEKW